MGSRICKICQKPIRGRPDKIFCSVACKNYYHIHLRKNTDAVVEPINRILHRNRSILQEVLGKNGVQKNISLLELNQRQFRFDYHTHLRTNSAGKVYHYVYDLAWMAFSSDTVLVVRQRQTI